MGQCLPSPFLLPSAGACLLSLRLRGAVVDAAGLLEVWHCEGDVVSWKILQ